MGGERPRTLHYTQYNKRSYKQEPGRKAGRPHVCNYGDYNKRLYKAAGGSHPHLRVGRSLDMLQSSCNKPRAMLTKLTAPPHPTHSFHPPPQFPHRTSLSALPRMLIHPGEPELCLLGRKAHPDAEPCRQLSRTR